MLANDIYCMLHFISHIQHLFSYIGWHSLYTHDNYCCYTHIMYFVIVHTSFVVCGDVASLFLPSLMHSCFNIYYKNMLICDLFSLLFSIHCLSCPIFTLAAISYRNFSILQYGSLVASVLILSVSSCFKLECFLYLSFYSYRSISKCSTSRIKGGIPQIQQVPPRPSPLVLHMEQIVLDKKITFFPLHCFLPLFTLAMGIVSYTSYAIGGDV